ncbi:UTP--glucose-1-phosphate uridylyltransferase, partial [Bacillus cereus]|nr:UTP--glucose-1-phosphate uridylyltransferase [Bacillus cereus]
AYDYEGKRNAVGEKQVFVQTTIEMALQHPELRHDMVEMIKTILE